MAESLNSSVADVQLSAAFKRETRKAIIAIVLFILLYIVLFTAALALAAASLYAGFTVIINYPRILGILLGVGIMSVGCLLFIFLVKFIFSSNKADRSNLLRIYPKDEPKLFAMINSLAKEVGTSPPKQVYLASDVNAFVFYDSSFWSMFLPVRKNLAIGMGLVNAVSDEELRAVLAHEFGHFSQRTMKVGSYVYNVNKVIHNMLFQNDSYNSLVSGLASIHAAITIFVMLAAKTAEGIQWILAKMYNYVNKQHMALSRQMEFHADEIAANVVGSRPLITSLLRLDFAQHALDQTLGLNEEFVGENVRSKNMYPEHRYVMNFLAEKGEHPKVNGLIMITGEDHKKYNKSKLNIEDGWASHPSLEERTERLAQLNKPNTKDSVSGAISLFQDPDGAEEAMTNHLYKTVVFQTEPAESDLTRFKERYLTNWDKNTFNEVYNNYYDNKNPAILDLDNLPLSTTADFKELFDKQKINLVYEYIHMKGDIDNIQLIAENKIKVKRFEYDGKVYKRKEAWALLKELNSQLEKLEAEILLNDQLIYRYFEKLEAEKGTPGKLRQLAQVFFEADKKVDEQQQLVKNLWESLEFVAVQNSYDDISRNFRIVRKLENKLKEQLEPLVDDEEVLREMGEDVVKNLKTYLSKDWVYFGTERYYDANLEMLYSVINQFSGIAGGKYFQRKKDLLSYQAAMLN